MSTRFFTNEELAAILFHSVMEWNHLGIFHEISILNDESKLEIRRSLIHKRQKYYSSLDDDSKDTLNDLIDKLENDSDRKKLKLRIPFEVNVSIFRNYLYLGEISPSLITKLDIVVTHDKCSNREILTEWILNNFNDEQRGILVKELDKYNIDNGNFFQIRDRIKNYIPF